jgi:hypothetical protein
MIAMASNIHPAHGPSTNPVRSNNYPAGQRLHCTKCGSEIEIINPCTRNPPDQVLSCCGQDMTPTTGRATHLGVE